MDSKQNVIEGLIQELRRGTIVLAVLSQLKKPQYGYGLGVILEEKGFPIEAGTLYPLLRRLEKQEILMSQWNTEGTKPRKYYLLSDFGQEILSGMIEAWRKLDRTMDVLLKEDNDGFN